MDNDGLEGSVTPNRQLAPADQTEDEDEKVDSGDSSSPFYTYSHQRRVEFSTSKYWAHQAAGGQRSRALSETRSRSNTGEGSGEGNVTEGPATGPRLDPHIEIEEAIDNGYTGPSNDSALGPDKSPELSPELTSLYTSFQECIDVRAKYMAMSLQRLGDNPKDWDGEGGPGQTSEGTSQRPKWNIYPRPPTSQWGDGPPKYLQESLDRQVSKDRDRPGSLRAPSAAQNGRGSHIGQGFDREHCEIPTAMRDVEFALDETGVYRWRKPSSMEWLHDVPSIRDYYLALDRILAIISDGPNKSFAFRRLKYLEGTFSMYQLLNEYQELADCKKVSHRDFYNVRKVDTHVHHSACFNQKHLLRFIKSKLKKSPDDVVIYRDDRHLTLKQVFESLNLTGYDLSIDTLDMHAHQDSFHRFDKFNLKYNPIGESRLREIFLKTDNYIQGRYLAEITREVFSDLEASKYQFAEYRISIYGRSKDEWDKLARWVVGNKLMSHQVRWLIQIPRLYNVYKENGTVDNFADILKNVFEPIFEVSRDPSTHPDLHIFLQRVIGFDSVDDESKGERRIYKKFPYPHLWNTMQNPPYSYYIYYLFANIASVNMLRQRRSFNTFVLRPHSGEAGDTDHLACAYLTSHSISHGILLRKVPVLQYLYYLDQIGIAMSPLSNNALFLTYERNPLPTYLRQGMNISISTDDPLQFHYCADALIEEYSVAAQIWKLSSQDMCELARNSVLQSGWEMEVKKHWLGSQWHLPGIQGNNPHKTNVPNRRIDFRHKTWTAERQMISHYAKVQQPEPLDHAGHAPSKESANHADLKTYRDDCQGLSSAVAAVQVTQSGSLRTPAGTMSARVLPRQSTIEREAVKRQPERKLRLILPGSLMVLSLALILPVILQTKPTLDIVFPELSKKYISLWIRDLPLDVSNHIMGLDDVFLPLLANLGFGIISFLFTIWLIPYTGAGFIKVGLVGKDMLKLDKPTIPECAGVITASVYIVTMFCFLAIPFRPWWSRSRIAEIELDSADNFPHQLLSSLLSSLLSILSATFLGFLDDVFDIRWRYKMPIPIIASIPLLAVYHAAGGLTTVVVPLVVRDYLGSLFDLGLFYYIYMSFLTTFCTNSINIIAGANGVEVGQSVIIGLSLLINDFTFIWPAVRNGVVTELVERHIFSAYLVIPFTATSLGLLWHNWYPARVFVGDTYCYFAGMLFAVVGILGHFSKTLLLFFIPQLFNFLLSCPQLFGWVDCPRHRMPVLAEGESKKQGGPPLLNPSRTIFSRDKPPVGSKRLVIETFGALRLVRIERAPEGGIASVTNFTILNTILVNAGPMTEPQLTMSIMAIQLVCSGLAFFVRYPLASFFYKGELMGM